MLRTLGLWASLTMLIGSTCLLSVCVGHVARYVSCYNFLHFSMYTMDETNFCFAQRRFASDQTRRAYTALNEQFDVYTGVIWQPYTQAAINARYPGGISELCTRDRDYWMTQSKIMFDVFIEVMAQQRVMRQFGLRQLVEPPPTEDPLPPVVHRYCLLIQCCIVFHNCP